jgi:hypothetical protein
MRWGRVVLAAVVGLIVQSLLFGVLFGNPAVRPLLFESGGGQVEPLVDFWQGPPPPAVTPYGAVEPGPRALVVMAGLLAWMFVIAALFERVKSALGSGTLQRGALFGLAMWGVTYLFFETWVPYNVLHEPLRLVAVELGLEAIGMVFVGIAIALVLRESRPASA